MKNLLIRLEVVQRVGDISISISVTFVSGMIFYLHMIFNYLMKFPSSRFKTTKINLTSVYVESTMSFFIANCRIIPRMKRWI